jgi:hypothetical protein
MAREKYTLPLPINIIPAPVPLLNSIAFVSLLRLKVKGYVASKINIARLYLVTIFE